MQEALDQPGPTMKQEIDQSAHGGSDVNVGQTERWASALAGGALAIYGLTRRTWGGAVLAVVGGSLIYRGSSGYCQMYEMLGVNTATAKSDNPLVSVPASKGIKVEKSVMINRSPEDLYRFWRRLENLPLFMNHLESVTSTGPGRSHWIARAPAGKTVEWEAEIYNEKENELIAWRSLEGADVDNAGSVRFEPVEGGRATLIKVTLKYDPPAGIIGSLVAKLFGEEPSQQIEEDLDRLKEVMEARGATPAEAPPFGRSAGA